VPRTHRSEQSCMDCSEPVHAKGRCSRHYYLYRKSIGVILQAKLQHNCRICGYTPIVARAMCGAHYVRFMKGVLLDTPIRGRVPKAITCIVEGCDRRTRAHGYCNTHYRHYFGNRDADNARSRERHVAYRRYRRYIQALREIGPVPPELVPVAA
jgi:hypothetical protein